MTEIQKILGTLKWSDDSDYGKIITHQSFYNWRDGKSKPTLKSIIKLYKSGVIKHAEAIRLGEDRMKDVKDKYILENYRKWLVFMKANEVDLAEKYS